MRFDSWIAAGGALLLLLGLTSAYVKKLPLSTSIVYLAVGVALGPFGFGLIDIELREASDWFENACETAVVVSLFIGGLRLRLSPRHSAWLAAYRLAGPVMVVCIAAVTAVAYLALDLSLPTSLLLGALLAPTDPVLASAVTVGNATDRDPLRYALSGEAGLNDGAAFPFVVLALRLTKDRAHPALLRWVLLDLVWATAAALVIGFFLGRAVARLAIRLQSHHRDSNAPNDLLALALIAISYAAADAVGAQGFLACFAAGVGLRHAEVEVVRANPHPDWTPDENGPASETRHPPAEHLVAANATHEALQQPAVAAGVLVAQTLSFGDTLERLFEMTLIVVIGATLPFHWTWRGAVLAMVLFLVVRPLTTRVLLSGTQTTARQRWIIGLFGVRGIGSLYYVAYAAEWCRDHATSMDSAVVDYALTAVACSVLLHGVASTPTLRWYERRVERV